MPNVKIPGLGSVSFPDTMSPDQIQSAIETDIWPSVMQKAKSVDPSLENMGNPTGSFGENLVAGFGKPFVGVGRGLQQMSAGTALGGAGLAGDPYGQQSLSDLISPKSPYLDEAARQYYQGEQQHAQQLQQTIDEQRQLDKPLMHTAGGVIGDIAGNVSMAAPTVFIPGANTVTGAGAIGSVLNAIQPTATGESRGQNAAIGFAAGATPIALFRGGKAAYQGVKSLIEPFTESGQSQIAGRTLNRFLQPDAFQNMATNPQGINYTLAESTLDPGAATMQRALASGEPRVASQLTERQVQNNAARVAALRGLGGSPEQIMAAEEARAALTEPLYQAASSQTAKTNGELVSLLQRPSVAKAWNRAQQLAQERGESLPDISELLTPIRNPDGSFAGRSDVSVKGLHYLKMSLDDLLDTAPTSGIGSHEKSAIVQTKNALLDWLDKASPEYGQARVGYREASQPITQMQLANALLRRGSTPTTDVLGNPTLLPSQFNRTVRDSAGVIREAGGLKAQGLEDIFTPEQMSVVNDVAQGLTRQQNAQNLAKAVGSNTFQNLSSGNIAAQAGAPLGIPEVGQNFVSGLINSTPFVGRALQAKDALIREKLAQALLDPQYAQGLSAGAKSIPSPLFAKAQRFAPIAPESLAMYLTQQ